MKLSQTQESILGAAILAVVLVTTCALQYFRACKRAEIINKAKTEEITPAEALWLSN